MGSGQNLPLCTVRSVLELLYVPHSNMDETQPTPNERDILSSAIGVRYDAASLAASSETHYEQGDIDQTFKSSVLRGINDLKNSVLDISRKVHSL